MSRKALTIGVVAVVILAALGGGLGYYFTHRTGPMPTYNVGIVTWVGYGPLFLAQEKGLFEKEGIKVAIKVMDGPGEREAAFLSGAIHFFPNTPDAFAILATQGIKGTIVMPMDESAGADGIVALNTITSVRDLKGKSIGVMTGITGHFFLLYELSKVGLGQSDVVIKSMGSGEAGAAFMAGQLDAAVTWEPWLSKAKEKEDGHILLTSKDEPGLLADVLMVQDSLLKSKPEDVRKFMKVWFDALKYWDDHPDESLRIMADALQLSVEELKAMYETDIFFDCARSKAYLGTKGHLGQAYEIFKIAGELYKKAGVIEREVQNPEGYFDPTPLNEVCR